MSGAINRLTLNFNDLNKETEYQDNKNSREIGGKYYKYVKQTNS